MFENWGEKANFTLGNLDFVIKEACDFNFW